MKYGKLGKKPAGPHLITKADLKEKIVNIGRKNMTTYKNLLILGGRT